MSKRSIKELESDIEETLQEIANINIEIEKHKETNSDALSLRLLRQGSFDYVLALEDSIKSEMEKPIRNAVLVLAEKMHEAEIEMVVAERRVQAFDEGSFTQRWDSYKAAEARWLSAIETIRTHRSSYPSFYS